RVRLGQTGRETLQQRPAWAIQAQPNECLELSGHEQFCAARPDTWSRSPSDCQADCDGLRRHPRRDTARRHRPGPLLRQRHDDSRCRADGTARLCDRARSGSRGYGHCAMGTNDQAGRGSCERQDVPGNPRRAARREGGTMMPQREGGRGGAPATAGRKSRARRRQRSASRESALAIMDRLLTSPVSITVSGELKQVSAVEAIVLQLLQKAASGSLRACQALSKYQEFASRHSNKSLELIFAESAYTKALAAFTSRTDDG